MVHRLAVAGPGSGGLAALIVFTSVASAQCASSWLPGELGGANAPVQAAVAWDPDGAGPLPVLHVFGGAFTLAGDRLADGIVCREPGSGAWSGLGAGLQGGAVHSLAVLQNGDLVAAGAFTASGATPLGRIARWNGSAWSPLGQGLNGDVAEIVVRGNGDLVAVGTFSQAGGAPAAMVARWNGTSWQALAQSITGSFVYLDAVVAAGNGDVVVGGNFASIDGVAAAAVARWNGSNWTALAGGFPGLVVTALLELPNGDLVASPGYAAGLRRWNGSSWSQLGATLDLAARDLALLPNGDLVAAGAWIFHAGLDVGTVARWNGSAWSEVGMSPNGAVETVLVTAGAGLVAGGDFTGAGVSGARNLAQWAPGGDWRPLGGSFDADVLATAAMPDGSVVVGGWFMEVAGTPAAHVARFTGSGWQALGAGVDATVYAVAGMPNGDVVVGGPFLTAGGVPASGIARWNGTTWSALGAGIAGSVHGLFVLPGGDLVAVGVFLTAGGVAANGIARWNGTTWSAFGNGLSGPVWAVAAEANGQLVVGGDFPGYVARWNGSSWALLGGGLNGSVRALALAPDGSFYAAGFFVPGPSSPAQRVARWNGSTWSSVGTPPFGYVMALAVAPDGALLAGGARSVGSTDVAELQRWNGVTWQSLGGGVAGSGAIDAVMALAVHPSGDVLAGGHFATAGGLPSPYFARHATSCPAAVTAVGAGCAGAGGMNQLLAGSSPWVGARFLSRATGLSSGGLAVAILGLAAQSTPLAAVVPQGLPGCSLLVSPDVLTALVPVAGGVEASFSIPATPALAAHTFRQQVVGLDLTASGTILAFTSTNALLAVIGSY